MSKYLSSFEKEKLKTLLIDLGYEAEKIKLNSKSFRVKSDKSPVSEADYLINSKLINFVKQTEFKNIISEEVIAPPLSERKNWEYFWLIDPLDGTKDFLLQGNDYTLNIALCKKNKPIFSAVYAPARKLLYSAEINCGSFLNGERIYCDSKIKKQLNIVASKSHINRKTLNFIDSLKSKYEIALTNFSSSLKICKIAEGKAHIYPRFGTTMEWDICAADLILSESGGVIADENGNEILYNKEMLENPYFVASSINL